MTVQQYISSLDMKINNLSGAFGRAVASVHAETVKRIFQDGIATNGGKTGTYNSTNGIYVNPRTAPRTFNVRGKNSKRATFKNGKQRKTGYFDSYKSFRGNQKRETGFVNLVLTGFLQRDYSAKLTRVNPFLYQAGVSNAANANKISGIENKYGKVFAPTVKERRYFNDILQKELTDILS